MREPMATELRTPRLILSAFVMDDAEELHAIFSDPHTHTIGSGPYTSLAQTREWVARRGQRYAQHGLAWYAVRDRKNRELIGNAGLFMGRTGTEPEIGYEVTVAWQGQGLATEAATAVVREAEQRTWPRLWATVRPANAASRSVLARLEFVEDSVRDSGEGPLIYLRREGRGDGEGAR